MFNNQHTLHLIMKEKDIFSLNNYIWITSQEVCVDATELVSRVINEGLSSMYDFIPFFCVSSAFGQYMI